MVQIVNTKYSIGDKVFYYSNYFGFEEKTISGIKITIKGGDEKTEYQFEETEFGGRSLSMDIWRSEDEVYYSKEDFINKIKQM